MWIEKTVDEGIDLEKIKSVTKHFLALLFLLLFLLSCAHLDKEHTANYSDEKQVKTYNTLRSFLKVDPLPVDSIEFHFKTLTNDSLKNEFIFRYSYYFYKQNDSVGFKKWNKKGLELSLSLGDTSKIAETNWDLGNYYFRRNQNDSSYYYYNKAYNLYEAVEEDFIAGRMLFNMAVIQNNNKDFAGSEVTTIKAIEKFKPLKKKKQLYKAYNNLGIIYNELEEYSKSLEFHQKALEYGGSLNDPLLKASSLNNMGVVFRNSGKQKEAIGNYKEGLTVDSIREKKPKIYAMLLDNLAYSRFLLNDTTGIKEQFLRALEVREQFGHKAGVAINKIHLSEYHLKRKDTLQAIAYASQVRDFSQKNNLITTYLSATLLLAEIDKRNSKENFQTYISIKDSLQKNERAIRNKFARIRYETDEFIAENKYLNRERKLIIGSSVLGFGVVSLIIAFFFQRARNKKLRLEKEQQKSNEEIYNLLLYQQKKLEETRNREKNRISRELHDGVLGNLVGNIYMLSHLSEKKDENSLQSMQKYINDLWLIEEEIRSISHNLYSDFITSRVSFLHLMEQLLEERQKIGKYEYILENDELIAWDKLSSNIKINLYRIIQEAINNINKYAAAGKVSIAFKKEDKNISLQIFDNGKGFDPEKAGKGMGLKNMKSRVKSLGGNFQLNSDREGTKIEIKIPIKNTQLKKGLILSDPRRLSSFQMS